jgi:hypothetical protein
MGPWLLSVIILSSCNFGFSSGFGKISECFSSPLPLY